MAYDLEEQEQLDALRAWWKRNGKVVTWLVIAALAAFVAWRAWQYYQHKQGLEASSLYEALTQLDSKDIKAVRSQSAVLIEKYADTPYAARAALLAARANYEANDIKSAKAQLEWARANAREEAIRAIAQLQLAGLQYEEKQYDAALATLADKPVAGFEGLFADLKGDILVAQGKKAEAKAAYAEALSKLNAEGHYRRFTERKLDALGG